ncbi:hypothetical protein [Companilactobacillus baiquanensis]|uniref:YtxH domain-containing protein n=1 Tax=Companilactobacillus baiquanensis TaxID=2486005 RepID=A0ABW1URY4_9LACO|nr:hypothetical protein [Companilactobacillus baiquanensis]
MKFATGFIIGTISGVALNYYQKGSLTKDANKVLKNIKIIKESLTELSNNVKVVPGVVKDLQKDFSDYTSDIQPDVENIQSTISKMQDNLDEFKSING